MGLNAALATAGHSLEVFTAGLQVAGQNVANASTPGYIREELELVTAPPYRRGSLIFGTGVLALGVQQQIDRFLESRLHTATSHLTAARARESIFQQLEGELRELGDEDLSTSLNRFLAALHDVANQPEVATNRQFAVAQGQQLAADVLSLRARIDEIRLAQDERVNLLIGEANELIDEVARLNRQIAQLEFSGLSASDAGALRTERYSALNRLAEIMPIRTVERANGEVDLFSGSGFLVLSGETQHLVAAEAIDRGVAIHSVQMSRTNCPLATGGGELNGILEARDTIVGGFVDQLDRLASALIFEFNRLHSSGEGVSGFTNLSSESRLTDPTLALNAAGLAFTPNHGSFQLRVVNAATGIAETTTLNIDLDGIGADTSLSDLQAALDAIDGVSATITAQGRLQITADSGFEFRFAEDTSGVLAALGINTFFTGSDSSNIGVNAALVANPDLLATGRGGGPADNRNALELARFLDISITTLGGKSLEEFYNIAIADLAQASAAETTIAEGLDAFRTSLQNQRDQFSGVSLDEEAVRLLEFQRAYQSAARIISVVDELFRTLLSL